MSQLVVDANVGCSAAPTSSNAAALASAEALAAISRRREHRVVMNDALWAEWDVHRSRTSLAWLREMTSQRRLSFVVADPCDDVRLRLPHIPSNAADEIEKDLHVFGLALATHRRVLSLETSCEKAVRTHVLATVPRLGSIHWVSPERADAVDWIEAGCPDRPAFRVDRA